MIRRRSRPDPLADVLRRLAADTCGPVGEAAFDVIRGAMSEENGLGFVPRASVSVAFKGAEDRGVTVTLTTRGIDLSLGEPEPRRESMPFARDFRGGRDNPRSPRRPRERPEVRSDRRTRQRPAFRHEPDPPGRARRTRREAEARARADAEAWAQEEAAHAQEAEEAKKTAAAYATLGLSPGAAPEDIKRQKHKLARRYHADLHGPGQEERLKGVNSAADHLTAVLG